VIPYFKLTNPAFDADPSVLSDNPYGCKTAVTTSDKCLLPERPVGRMPDGNGGSVELLLSQLETASQAASSSAKSKLPARVFSIMESSMGYTAAIWKKASQHIWSQLSLSSRLRVCPPLSYLDVKASWFKTKGFLYFNLHGSDREPYWYGQKGQTYPTALSPANVSRFSRGKNVALTEACYGAIEKGKESRTSIALAFMSSGSLCVLGSTCIAYGAILPPVSEADLIGFHFFANIRKGFSFGEAFVNARAQLAAAAISRQGFLDEDDRKTLLQFVLFGDPTVRVLPTSGSGEDAKSS
jgi:hypothetical protein